MLTSERAVSHTRPELPVLRGDRIGLFRLDDLSDEHRAMRRHPRWSHVVVYARTRSVISWGGQMLELDAGECLVATNSQTVVAAAGDPGFAIAMYLPRNEAQPYVTELAAACDRVQTTKHGSSRIAGSVLQCLADGLEEDPGSTIRIDQHIIGLVASMCQDSMVDDKTELIASCKRFIDAHLSDPELSLDAVARAACMSPRALHRLFGSEDLTVSAWIRNRRLERCAHDLEDASLVQLSITQIHQRWGLFDSSHFSYLFRRRFGMSPRVFRACRVASETRNSAA